MASHEEIRARVRSLPTEALALLGAAMREVVIEESAPPAAVARLQVMRKEIGDELKRRGVAVDDAGVVAHLTYQGTVARPAEKRGFQA